MSMQDELAALNFPQFPIPLRLPAVSGLYAHAQEVINLPIPTPVPNFPPIPDPGPINPGPFNPGPIRPVGPVGTGFSAAAGRNFPIRRGYGGELRLDVDGSYPQQIASGTLWSGMSAATAWVAHVASSGPLTWTGTIFYKDGSTSILPFTVVTITVTRANFFSAPTGATVVFSGGGGAGLTLDFAYQSPYFHTIEMEFDSVSGTSGVTSFDTGSHPNKPATLPSETLTLETIYRRAGFDVSKSGGDSAVPLSGSGTDSKWSITEMNDAMSTYWSRFSSLAKWSLWTMFASLSDQGTSLGGIMFDYSGTTQRQGCAIFENAFISQPPNGEAHPTEWVRRMRFWTAAHEIGHTFNLAHSWQESMTQNGNGPWIALTDEPEGRTFMNYPYNVNGGTSAFFSDFAYRFSDQELLFLRHAPVRFVEQGNADWFDNHGFRNANPLTGCPTSIWASVVLVTVNVIGPLKAPAPPLPQLVQKIPHIQTPVPSAIIGPAAAAIGWPVPETIFVIFARVMAASSKRKFIPPPAPVSTNLLPLSRETATLTLAPTWVRVTVPKPPFWGPQPPVQWSLVNVKVSARAEPAVDSRAIARIAKRFFGVFILIMSPNG